MNEMMLSHFKHLAKDLSGRKRIKTTIILATRKELKAVYDPLFRIFTMGGMTFPLKELATWTKLCWGSFPIDVIIEEVQTEETSNEVTTL